MAAMSEVELRRKLQELERKSGGSEVKIVQGVPGGRARDGDLAWDAVNDNLYLFNNNAYELVPTEGAEGAVGAAGYDGTNGAFRIFQYKNSTTLPTTPTGGSFVAATSTLNPSIGWTGASVALNEGESEYEVYSTFIPSAAEVEIKEEGFFDVSNTPGVDGTGTKEQLKVSDTNGITGVTTDHAATFEVPRVGITGSAAGSDASNAAAEVAEVTHTGTSSAGLANAYFTYTLSDDNYKAAGILNSDYIIFRATNESPVSFTLTNGTYTAEEFATGTVTLFNNTTNSGFTASSSGRVITLTKDDSSDFTWDDGANGLCRISLTSSETNNVTISSFDGDGTLVTTVSTTGGVPSLPGSTISSGAGGTLDSMSYTFDNTETVVYSDIPASTTAASYIALEKTFLDAEITAGNLTGFTVATVTDAIISTNPTVTGNGNRVTHTATGTVVDLTIVNTGGTGSTLTPTVIISTQGTDGTTTTRDTWTAVAGSPHSPASASGTFTNGQLVANCRTTIRDLLVSNTIGGYSNVTAYGSNTYFEMTSNTSGVESDFILTIIQGTGSDLIATNSVTTSGEAAYTAGTLTGWTLNVDGTNYSQDYPSETNATNQLQIPHNYALSQSLDSTLVDGVWTVTSATIGPKANFAFAISLNGTDQTATQPTTVPVDGLAETTTQDSIKLALVGTQETNEEFNSGITTAQVAIRIANTSNTHVVFSRANDYEIATYPLTSGSERIKFAYINGGSVTNNTTDNVVITTGNTGGTLAVTAPTTTVEGISTGTLGIWSTPPRKTTGSDGSGALTMVVDSSNGTVFKNNIGSTALTANVYENGILLSSSDHTNVFHYKWSVGNSVVCIDSNGSVQNNASGQPEVANSSGVCLLGIPAQTDFAVCVNTDNTVDGTLTTKGICEGAGKTWQANTRGGDNRSITVGAEDVATTGQFLCEVSNIPD